MLSGAKHPVFGFQNDTIHPIGLRLNSQVLVSRQSVNQIVNHLNNTTTKFCLM